MVISTNHKSNSCGHLPNTEASFVLAKIQLPLWNLLFQINPSWLCRSWHSWGWRIAENLLSESCFFIAYPVVGLSVRPACFLACSISLLPLPSSWLARDLLLLTSLCMSSLRHFSSAQFSSVTQSCPTLCDPMNHSTPGLPVHHQLPEFTQTHVHWVGDAIQPSHPLLSSSPPAPNPSQHQSLFQWVNSSHEVAKVLEFQL